MDRIVAVDRAVPERQPLPAALTQLVEGAVGLPPPTQRGLRTYTQILEAGRAAFTRADYQEVAVERLAEEARTSVGSVYRYFGSKENLFLVVLADCLGELYEAARSVWSMPWGYLERLQVSTERYLKSYADNRFILGSAAQLTMASANVREMTWAMRNIIHRAMASRLAEDQRTTGLEPLETETLMRGLSAMVDGYAQRAYVDVEFGTAEFLQSQMEHAAVVLAEVWYRSIFGSAAVPDPAELDSGRA